MILPYLEWIDLSDNKIQDITPLTKLKETLKRIYLQNNQIKDIKPFLDSDFPELEKLRIDSENLIKKESNDFSELKTKFGKKLIYNEYGIKEFLEEYNINHDYSIRINGQVFESERKNIKDKIEESESGKTKDIDKIVINDLDLDENKFNLLIKDLYLIIPKDNEIRKLGLQNNKIKDIPLISRLYLPYLEVLDLSVNNLTNLNFLNEINFKNIKYLFLDNNKINNVIPLDNYIKSMYEFYSNANYDNNISNEPKLKLKIICLCDNCFLIKEDEGKKIIVVDKEIKQYVEKWKNCGITLDIKNEENE
jgi:Leucine-rich repeat (LRR) protein